MNIDRISLQHNKEFMMFIFLFILSMCNLQKRFPDLSRKDRSDSASRVGEKMSKDFLEFCKLISNLMLGQIVV